MRIENPKLNRNFDSQIDELTGDHNVMGIIDALKKIEREEGFVKGIEKGAEQKSYEFVKNLLLNTDFDDAKVASLTNVSEAFIKKVKKDLKK